MSGVFELVLQLPESILTSRSAVDGSDDIALLQSCGCSRRVRYDSLHNEGFEVISFGFQDEAARIP
jgi:hypothetical protein